MREKLNENPKVQIAVIGVLLLAVGLFALTKMGGGGESESTETVTSSATVTTPEGTASVVATVTVPTGTEAAATPVSLASAPEVPASPLPPKVTAAFDAGHTVVLLVVKRGGIDDARTVAASLPVGFSRGVSLFIVPVRWAARYASITQGVKLERVPALIVVSPKRLDHGVTAASISYGYQTTEGVMQAVKDANYRGGTLPYHP
ncbi:MAG: hypothetical protein ACRDPE_07690 [Solirubrobacterales bacterium]